MNQIKLIAIDMDGTWLRSDCSISEPTKRAIRAAVEAGYLIVPSTGRCFCNTKTVLRDFGLSYYINANGTIVTDAKEEKLVHAECFDRETAEAIFRLVEEADAFTEIYESFDAHVDKKGREFLIRAGLAGDYVEQLLSTNIEHESLGDFMREASGRISKFHIVCETPEKKEALKEKIAALPGVYPISIFHLNIEVVNGRWSKADGLRTLTAYLGLTPDQVMAIGDSNNDADMLRWAGTSVAMGNAPRHIKELADFVTSSNDEDGIVKAFEKYLDI